MDFGAAPAPKLSWLPSREERVRAERLAAEEEAAAEMRRAEEAAVAAEARRVAAAEARNEYEKRRGSMG